MDVGRVFSPFEKLASRGLKLVPSLVSGQSLRVEFLEKSGGHRGRDNLLDVSTRRPDVLKHHWLSVLVITDRVLFEVNVDGSSKGVGDNKRRTG
jgi:hypothetical protein